MSHEHLGSPNDATPYGPTLFSSIVRYRYAVTAAVLTLSAIGYLLSSQRTPVYEATATVILSNNSFDESSDFLRTVEQEAIRVSSRDVISRAARLLGDTDGRESAINVHVAPDSTVGLLDVTATASDPRRATNIANAVVSAYEEASTEAVTNQTRRVTDILQKQQDELSAQIAELESSSSNAAATSQRVEILRAQSTAIQTRIAELTANAAIYGSGVSEVEEALPPTRPSSPNPLRDAAATGVAALVVASGLAYWRAASEDKRNLDPASILETPLLAQIPQFRRTSGDTATEPLFDIDATEAYQFLLSSIEFRLQQTGARSILVTSATSGEGKSLTSLHLARALAEQGRETILVDADIRVQGLSMLLKADDHKGLASLAEGEEIENVIRRYRITPTSQLQLVPSGKPPDQRTGLLATEKYREAIAKIIAASDLTIIDGGPLLTVADASAVATQVAGILLVLDARTSEDDLRRLRDRLRLIPTPLLGYVINRAS